MLLHTRLTFNLTFQRLVAQPSVFANEIFQVAKFGFEHQIPVTPLGQVVQQRAVLQTHERLLPVGRTEHADRATHALRNVTERTFN